MVTKFEVTNFEVTKFWSHKFWSHIKLFIFAYFFRVNNSTDFELVYISYHFLTFILRFSWENQIQNSKIDSFAFFQMPIFCFQITVLFKKINLLWCINSKCFVRLLNKIYLCDKSQIFKHLSYIFKIWTPAKWFPNNAKQSITSLRPPPLN